MRGTVAKRIHSFQASVSRLSWRRARRLWNDMLADERPRSQPRDTETAKQRKRRLDRIKSGRKPSRVARYGISTCASHGVRRHPPYAKVSMRKIRSAWLRAARAAELSPKNTLLQAARDQFTSAIKLAAKGMSRIGGMFKRGNGRGA